MGFCIAGSDQYDVFLSYAHADNILHVQWVRDFERHLRETLIAELGLADEVRHEDTLQLKVCRDQTGFPQGGDLRDVIDEKVRQSQFLFIFLGRGYLRSEWCLAELDIFRKYAGGGTIEGALKRLYVIVLDREAEHKLQEGKEPEHLPQERKRLWANLRAITRNAIRKDDFLQPDGGLMPVLQAGDTSYDFHTRCTPLVKELAIKLIDCRRNLQPQIQSLEKAPLATEIVIGAVPRRLEEARGDLIKALGSTKSYSIEVDDLRDPSDKLRNCLRDARLLVQPFDHFEPLCRRGDPRGGHLALQQKLFDECHGGEASASGASILWWEPISSGPIDAPAIDDYDKAFIDNLSEEHTRCCTAKALAAELLLREKRQLITPKVWIEWEESDEDAIERAKSIIREYFDAHCKQNKVQGWHVNATLQFSVADWSILERKLKVTPDKKPDSLVIVYNENKDVDAFLEQSEMISNLEEVLMREMSPGIFWMEGEKFYKPTDDWSFVRLLRSDQKNLHHNPAELKVFVERLFQVVACKYGGQARTHP